SLFLGYSAVFLGMKLVLATVAHSLYVRGMGALFLEDLSRFPPFSAFARIFTGQSTAANPPAIPYLRDYSDIIVMTLMAAHMALIHLQWKDISAAPLKLANDGVLNPRVVSLDRIKHTIAQYDKRFNLRSIRVLSRVAAAGLVLAFYRSFAQHGIYSGLNIPFVSGWELSAYLNWWERPSS